MKNLETYDFEMFSTSGNNACRSIVKKAINKISGTKRITEEEITQYCTTLINKVAEKHGEVKDTEPSWHIAKLIDKSLEEVGYKFSIRENF
jgi:hypothetical protein